MKNKSESIRKIVGFLNNVDEDGGFWLPNIQRHFVWSEEQTCRLFDSILQIGKISQSPSGKLLGFSITSMKMVASGYPTSSGISFGARSRLAGCLTQSFASTRSARSSSGRPRALSVIASSSKTGRARF